MSLLSRGSAIGLMSLAVGQGTTLVVEAGIARSLGVTSLGAFAVGASIAAIFAITIVSGCVVAVGRMVAAADAEGDRRSARGYVLLGFLIVELLAVPIALVVLVLSGQIGSLLGDSPDLPQVVAVFAASLPLQAGGAVALAANRALSRLYPDLLYLLADAVIRLLALPAIVFWHADVRLVAVVYFAAALLSFPFAAFPLARLILERDAQPKRPLRRREFLALMAGQTVASAIWAAARRGDTIAVASFVGSSAAGAYRIALLLASTGAVLQSAAGPILVPLSTRDLMSGGNEAILRRFRTVTRLTLVLSAPVFAICLATRDALIAAFGQAPGAIELTLVVLCFGFALDCAAGPGTSILVVAGQSWRATANIAIAFGAELVLLILLVPAFGPVGAALSLGLTFALVEGLQLFSIRRLVGGPVFDASLWSLVILVALLLVASLLIGGSPLSWISGLELIAALGAYAWLSLRFAVSRDELVSLLSVVALGRTQRVPG